MTSELADFATKAYAAWHGPDQDLAALREGFDTMHPEPAADITVTEATVGSVPGRWVAAPGSGEAVVIHVHGGAFMLGSSYAYRDFASRVARAAKARVFLPDYRLAPEHQCPAAADDVVAVYRALLADGIDSANVVVAGDSAGGNIALAAVVVLKKAGDPLPAGVVLLSPVADLTLSGDSMTALAAYDPISTKAAAEQGVGLYLPPDVDPGDDRASAIFADLSGLPPLLVQAGTHEILLDDAIRLAENARDANVEVDLQLSYQMIHVFQTFAYRFDEAQRAVDRIGEFVQRNVTSAN